MSIWTRVFTLDEVSSTRENTMLDHLGIEIIEIGDDFLKARMPVNAKTRQVYGVLHGGASCALAESVASIAANLCVDQNLYYCVGAEINTSHLRMVKEGFVTAIAKPLHLGRTSQVWEIPIYDDYNHLIAANRLRVMTLPK